VGEGIPLVEASSHQQESGFVFSVQGMVLSFYFIRNYWMVTSTNKGKITDQEQVSLLRNCGTFVIEKRSVYI